MTDWTVVALLSEMERRAEARQRVTVAMIRRVGREVTNAENRLDQDLDNIEASMAAESTAEQAELADLQRELADLVAKSNSGAITPEEHQRLANVQARIDAITSAETQATSDIDTADPQTSPTDPTSV